MSNDEILDQFILSEAQQALEIAVGNLPQGRVRNCGRNAFRRIRNAWLVRSIDPEMAAFSAITAEEEAASGLMYALQERGYRGHEQLNPHSHPHKAGLIHMIHAVSRLMHEFGFPEISARINREMPRIDVHINLERYGFPTFMSVATPDEPLNWTLTTGEEESRIPVTFAEQLQTIAKERNVGSFVKFIREKANFRNQVLYASEEGIPNVNAQLAYYTSKLKDISLLVGLSIAVVQASSPQPIAQQVLDSYLDILSQINRRR